MPLFVCPECQTVENTALATVVVDHAILSHRPSRGLAVEKYICSACGPGGWHGRFPQEKYDPQKHGPVEDGLIKPKAKGGCGCG